MTDDHPPRDENAHRDDPPGDGSPGDAPHIDESVRRIGRAGRATLGSALDTGRALRRLVAADLALARSATGRALAWFAVAIVFGASAWLLAMAATIALLKALGWSWLLSITACTVLNLVVTGLAAWRVAKFFDHAGMHATRRQLARMGIADEDDDGDEGDTMPPTAMPTDPT